MRNPITEWCVSHHQLSKGLNLGNGHFVGGCKKRIALTATPVFNKPLDMVGLCKAINTELCYQTKEYWSLDAKCKTINPLTVKNFQRFTDRVKDDILNLPPIHQIHHNFQAMLGNENAAHYNAILQATRALRMRMEKSKVSAVDMQKLMGFLQKMQQMLVSPVLAREGVEALRKNPKLVNEAAVLGSGSLQALHSHIKILQSKGHARIMVACCHVFPMRIAMEYIRIRHPDLAELFLYDGTLTLNRRQDERLAFLSAEKAILFLSIGAGGCGLHLVPPATNQLTGDPMPITGFCRSCIFWGSRPFSPAQVWQTLKRIHRIGQLHEVFVDHMIACGSVDYAIERVHKDKSGLASAIVDDDWSNCDEQGGNWKKTGRIVDSCIDLLEDGNFPDPKTGHQEPPPSSPTSTKKQKTSASTGSGKLPVSFAAPNPNLHPVFNPPAVPRASSSSYMMGPARMNVDAPRDATALAAEARSIAGPSSLAPVGEKRARED